MKKYYFLFVIVFILAFCSIVYELILAQALSAFLENTILRYSVTIGLYMFSIGIGTLFAEGRFIRTPSLTLLKVEFLLTIMGGFSIVLLFGLQALGVSRLLFSVFAHGLIVSIGILTGFEIPLLIAMLSREMKNPENMVLAFNYFGAFLGPLIFAFVFYKQWGLMATSFFIGFLNALVGLFIFLSDRNYILHKNLIEKKVYILQGALLTVIMLCWVNADTINEYFINHYLNI